MEVSQNDEALGLNKEWKSDSQDVFGWKFVWKEPLNQLVIKVRTQHKLFPMLILYFRVNKRENRSSSGFFGHRCSRKQGHGSIGLGGDSCRVTLQEFMVLPEDRLPSLKVRLKKGFLRRIPCAGNYLSQKRAFKRWVRENRL